MFPISEIYFLFRPRAPCFTPATAKDCASSFRTTRLVSVCAIRRTRKKGLDILAEYVLCSKRPRNDTTKGASNKMPSKEEIAVVRKATVYDLQKILDRGEKGKTYTVEEIKELMDAYVTGADQN